MDWPGRQRVYQGGEVRILEFGGPCRRLQWGWPWELNLRQEARAEGGQAQGGWYLAS